MSIPQYVRKLRMQRAAELLRSGRFNVTEAAMEVGYSSLSQLRRLSARSWAAVRRFIRLGANRPAHRETPLLPRPARRRRLDPGPVTEEYALVVEQFSVKKWQPTGSGPSTDSLQCHA